MRCAISRATEYPPYRTTHGVSTRACVDRVTRTTRFGSSKVERSVEAREVRVRVPPGPPSPRPDGCRHSPPKAAVQVRLLTRGPQRRVSKPGGCIGLKSRPTWFDPKTLHRFDRRSVESQRASRTQPADGAVLVPSQSARGLAARALVWGTRDRGFESHRPDKCLVSPLGGRQLVTLGRDGFNSRTRRYRSVA